MIASLHSSATQWSNKFLLEIYFENGFINLDGLITSTRTYIPETLKIFKKKTLVLFLNPIQRRAKILLLMRIILGKLKLKIILKNIK